jgi:hypothetical protein
MLALGIGVVVMVLLSCALKVAIALGGAYALTAYTDLPGIADTLIWVAGGGYSVLCIFGLFTTIAALAVAGRQHR